MAHPLHIDFFIYLYVITHFPSTRFQRIYATEQVHPLFQSVARLRSAKMQSEQGKDLQ